MTGPRLTTSGPGLSFLKARRPQKGTTLGKMGKDGADAGPTLILDLHDECRMKRRQRRDIAS
jgi:hypothetical protein